MPVQFEEAQRVWTTKAQYADAERALHTKRQIETVSSTPCDAPVKSNSDNNNITNNNNNNNNSNNNNNNNNKNKNANKKGKKGGASSAEPAPTIADNSTANQSNVSGTSSSTGNTDKYQKNDKNLKKQAQQPDASNPSANIEHVSDDSKHQSAKAKKLKAKKEKKAAKKLQQQLQHQQQDDSNKSNVSSISDDNFHTNETQARNASINIKCKPEYVKATKEQFNAKNLHVTNEPDNNTTKKVHVSGGASEECTLVSEIAKARQHLKNSLERMDDIAALAGQDVLDRIAALEKENADLRQTVKDLKNLQLNSDSRLKALEARLGSLSVSGAPAAAAAPTPAAAPAAADDDDDDVDLFGSDDEEEDAEAAKIREQRLAAYAAKKSNKPALIAKSNVILDVKPWDDETDMAEMERQVRTIVCDGLLWGTAKLVPLAYGIKKLTIASVVEDDKVSIDWLTEEIEKFDELVQSVDVAAFNKI